MPKANLLVIAPPDHHGLGILEPLRALSDIFSQ